MKHLLLTTIAAVVLVSTNAFAGPGEHFLVDEQSGYTSSYPIHDAAYDGNLAGVQAELDKGVDVDTRDYGIWDCWTPLHAAAFTGHKEIAELLIAEGADVNVIIQSGSFQEMTPLDMATDKNRTETEDLLRKHGGKTGEELDALFDAAKTGNVTDAKKAIADDLDVNARDDEGMTPLLYAVWEGHREIVELLLANGADTSAKNPDGQTPLDLAIEYDDTEIIDLLRKHQEPETMPSLIYSKDKLTINVPFDFRFTTKAGKSYTVEATGDLLKWYKVETIRGTGSEVKSTDIRKALFERQYYRVKVVD